MSTALPVESRRAQLTSVNEGVASLEEEARNGVQVATIDEGRIHVVIEAAAVIDKSPRDRSSERQGSVQPQIGSLPPLMSSPQSSAKPNSMSVRCCSIQSSVDPLAVPSCDPEVAAIPRVASCNVAHGGGVALFGVKANVDVVDGQVREAGLAVEYLSLAVGDGQSHLVALRRKCRHTIGRPPPRHR